MPFPLENFLLILMRLSGLFISAPIFASRQIPARIKVFIVLVLTLCLAYIVPISVPEGFTSAAVIAAALVMELIIGYTIGLVAYLVFSGMQLAGQIMDMQMGFGIVNVVDPLSGTQIPLMGNITQTFALLAFLAVNGHYYLIQAVSDSYNVIPVLGLTMKEDLLAYLVFLSANMFVIAIKIAAPLVLAILTADIAMGFIGRTVPQMNVFLVGLPLKIIIGFLVLLLLLPVYMWVFGNLFNQLFISLDTLVQIIGAKNT